MPVDFLTQAQRDAYGQYCGAPSQEDIERYFYLNDADFTVIRQLRHEHTRLGYAILLTSVRYLGVFPEQPALVPDAVLLTLCRQLAEL